MSVRSPKKVFGRLGTSDAEDRTSGAMFQGQQTVSLRKQKHVPSLMLGRFAFDCLPSFVVDVYCHIPSQLD